MKKEKITVTLSCVVILLVGIFYINASAERSERPVLVLILGSIMIVIQRIVMWNLKYKNRKRS
ncbi:hypothetical protein [Halalkalibacter hemicellulosilyticus]|uniref:Uncharacterized protein n=1 Tax=Halalkalibacter hemicellulosilyticusJCM 9152 TaxID=1236971 RepID=W4QCP9_9BACI|nr:hypothetical protein [Halalkalibacter hemicellulosilyticus]GAE29428.1 hypothetical protein JCM9152_785 [Halalkalibacter hemicellulosilyticusJCM 9152]